MNEQNNRVLKKVKNSYSRVLESFNKVLFGKIHFFGKQ